MDCRTLPPFLTEVEILDTYSRLCASPSGKVTLRLFCRVEHENETTCFIRVSGTAIDQIASRVKGATYGDTIVVILPLADDFSCPMRTAGRMQIPSCDQCTRLIAPDRSCIGEKKQ